MQILVTTAITLSSDQKKKLESALKAKYPKHNIEYVVNPACVGGIKITIDSKQIDMTVAHQLATMHKTLLAKI